MKKILKQQKSVNTNRCPAIKKCILSVSAGRMGAGAHKFYEGKTALGVLYLFTFGLFGTGWIFDLIAILSKKRRYLLHINYPV